MLKYKDINYRNCIYYDFNFFSIIVGEVAIDVRSRYFSVLKSNFDLYYKVLINVISLCEDEEFLSSTVNSWFPVIIKYSLVFEKSNIEHVVQSVKLSGVQNWFETNKTLLKWGNDKQSSQIIQEYLELCDA